jgi:hypothetical protein
MKAAATELTDNCKSITVTVQEGDRDYELVTQLTMRRAT